MAEHANKQKQQDGRSLVSDDPTLIATLAMRNLAEVFGENNPKRRRAAISEIYAEDAVVHAPPGAITGHDALDKFAGELRSTHPNFVYTRSAEPQVLHDSARLAWGSGPAGEPPRYTGEDFILARNGKITALYVYLDSPPS
jgi:hypothetical protein